VTHDQEEAMTMSDRIAVMNHGRYEQLGDPESLYEHPATAFVAGFLGVSNLLPAHVRGRDSDWARCDLSDGTALRLPAVAVDGQAAIQVGVRPEKIRLHASAAEAPAGTNQLAGRVVDASYLGVSTSYIVETASGARVTVYEQNVERSSRTSLHRPGDEVSLSWSPDHTFAVTADTPPLPQAQQEGALSA
jgi:spermidine/putrescine transport system ATP-binding protein